MCLTFSDFIIILSNSDLNLPFQHISKSCLWLVISLGVSLGNRSHLFCDIFDIPTNGVYIKNTIGLNCKVRLLFCASSTFSLRKTSVVSLVFVILQIP